MKWISVRDDLPSFNEPVLCYDTNKIYIAYRKDSDIDYNEHWAICEDKNCSCIGCTGAVIYWTPLPEAPINKFRLCKECEKRFLSE